MIKFLRPVLVLFLMISAVICFSQESEDGQSSSSREGSKETDVEENEKFPYVDLVHESIFDFHNRERLKEEREKLEFKEELFTEISNTIGVYQFEYQGTQYTAMLRSYGIIYVTRGEKNPIVIFYEDPKKKRKI